MRRKSIATYHVELDPTNSLTPKYANISTDNTMSTVVTKRVNKPRRNRSFRLSLQGFIDKS